MDLDNLHKSTIWNLYLRYGLKAYPNWLQISQSPTRNIPHPTSQITREEVVSVLADPKYHASATKRLLELRDEYQELFGMLEEARKPCKE